MGNDPRYPRAQALHLHGLPAHLGRFKPACDFDWNWPKRCVRAPWRT